jgi:hypothetical protein
MLTELARCLVTPGLKFLGRDTRQSSVIYVPAEDPEDVRNRLEALDLIDVRILVAEDTSLTKPRRVVALLESAIAEMRMLYPSRDIVIMYDTLRAGLNGQSVIDDRVTSPALVPLRKLVEKENVVLFLANHTNRQDHMQSKGETLESIVGMELIIARDGKERRLHIGKNRYGPSHRKIGSVTFRSVDVDGVPASLVDEIKLSDDDAPKTKEKPMAERTLDKLRELMGVPELQVAHGMAPGGYAVQTSRWFSAVEEAGILAANKKPGIRFSQLRMELKAAGKIDEDEEAGVSWIALPGTT